MHTHVVLFMRARVMIMIMFIVKTQMTMMVLMRMITMTMMIRTLHCAVDAGSHVWYVVEVMMNTMMKCS